MIETILFIATVIFIIGITMMEAQHDFWVIKFLYPGSKGQWKIWGNLYEICWIIFISAIVAELLNKYSPLLGMNKHLIIGLTNRRKAMELNRKFWICDDCGKYHSLMQDNEDGTYTCFDCLVKQADSNDIDREHG